MLYSQRIRLRSVERADLPRMVGWMNDPEIRQFIQMASPLSLAMEEKSFEGMIARPPAEQLLVIERKGEAGYEPIGSTGFHQVNWRDRSAEVGIVVGEKALWNQHYGGDAMRLMLRHGFQDLNLNRISLDVYVSNPRAVRSYERVGFVVEGRKRQAVFRAGSYQDVLIMAVLRSEWTDSDF